MVNKKDISCKKQLLRGIKLTKYHSKNIGKLPKGCRQCVRGEKTVLFITGLCSKRCFFCPISDKKKNKDVIYANEKPIKLFSELAEEIMLCDSKGVGITGGDPLVKLSRTVEWISLLKKEFGSKFHVHLYTPLVLVSEDSLKKLCLAGLDEIRFHPDLDNDIFWEQIIIAKKFDWKVGVEIPAIPGKLAATKKLVKFISDKIDFLNINELELSDTNASKLTAQGFSAKDNISYGVKGSESDAVKLLNYCLKLNLESQLDVHYCTTTLKDKVQLAKRIKKRANNIKKEYDYVDSDGTLIRGAIYLAELKPAVHYLHKLESLSTLKKQELLKKLVEMRKFLMKKYKIPFSLIEVDTEKIRILTTLTVVEELSFPLKEKELMPAIVQEYPTWDAMQLDVQFL
ncbi:radical SAM protein [Candidatus Woesearchaeota archaeon]|nr:radical SAM protein [Candidatus Woesearchaeota archaeon]